jgi:uncharacterized coiled-coil protein SlyX
MPVTVRLSSAFYERFGDDIADELTNWFNQVDAAYRGDLRELNELNFARFEAKLEQRVAELEARMTAHLERSVAELNAKIDRVAAELNAKIDRVAAELNAKIDRVAAELREHIERRLGEQTRWYFAAWAAQLAAIIGLWFRI